MRGFACEGIHDFRTNEMSFLSSSLSLSSARCKRRREREKERDRDRDRESESEREREGHRTEGGKEVRKEGELESRPNIGERDKRLGESKGRKTPFTQ